MLMYQLQPGEKLVHERHVALSSTYTTDAQLITQDGHRSQLEALKRLAYRKMGSKKEQAYGMDRSRAT